MSAQGTMPPPPWPSICCAPPVASNRSPANVCVQIASDAARRIFFMGSAGHDVAFHGRENAQELVLLAFAHAVVVERVAQELHDEGHLGIRVLEALVDLVQGVAGVGAAAARERADLLDGLLLHPRELHVLEGARGAWI